MPDFGTKDAAVQMEGVWIIQLAELKGMNRAEIASTKEFISRAEDRFRPPYGKRSMAFPRQCVFAGTINDIAYLKDDTGARRFWPVNCTPARLRLKDLERDRDQLWAKAVEHYKNGATWRLDTAE